jgi:CRP-like cAMP-binding protein
MNETQTLPAASAGELTGFSLFRSTPLADLQALAQVLRVRVYDPGELVFARGDRGDSMFLIRQGQVRIFIRDDQDNEVTFRFYGPQQAIGEFSLIDGQPRSASADAYDGAQLLVLSRDDFQALLRDHPMIGIEMMRELAERIRYTTRFLERVLAAVNLLQQDDYERALQEMSVEASDDQMQAMITSFVEMVQAVQARQMTITPPGSPSESQENLIS